VDYNKRSRSRTLFRGVERPATHQWPDKVIEERKAKKKKGKQREIIQKTHE
jgi:hypothetical protein